MSQSLDYERKSMSKDFDENDDDLADKIEERRTRKKRRNPGVLMLSGESLCYLN